MKDTLLLKDGTIINIEAGSCLSYVIVISETKENMIETWSKLTQENLSNIEFKNPDGVLIAKYSDIVLVNETSVILEDGTIKTSFNLREKTELEKLREIVEGLGEKSDIIEASVLELSEVVYA